MPPQSPLTAAAIRSLRVQVKAYKLGDGGGLYLEVMPNGAKYWRMKYRFNGKERRASFGVYPAVSLADARAKREEARAQLAKGIDPVAARRLDKELKAFAQANTLEAVALEWLNTRAGCVAPAQITKTAARLRNDVLPRLGARPITEITAPEILAVLRRITERGAAFTAHRVRSELSRIFRYAIATGRAERDPARDLIGAIPIPTTKHFAAITDTVRAGEMLRAFDAFSGTFPVQCALQLAPMLFCRPCELRKAEWKDIDLEAAEWRYLVTKTKTPHIVPLARQAVSILRALHTLTGSGRYLFHGARDISRPMSDAAINAALRRLGYDTKTEITGHGFRAMARTLLHEEFNVKPEVIEHQLAHRVPDTLGAAYNRTRFIKERKKMMQLWADALDKMKAGAEVIKLPNRRA